MRPTRYLLRQISLIFFEDSSRGITNTWTRAPTVRTRKDSNFRISIYDSLLSIFASDFLDNQN